MARRAPKEKPARRELTPEEKAAYIEELLKRRSDIRPDTTVSLVRAAREERVQITTAGPAFVIDLDEDFARTVAPEGYDFLLLSDPDIRSRLL